MGPIVLNGLTAAVIKWMVEWTKVAQVTPVLPTPRKATMGRELIAPRTDRTTRIPSGVATPVTTNHAPKESVFVNLRNAGTLTPNHQPQTPNSPLLGPYRRPGVTALEGLHAMPAACTLLFLVRGIRGGGSGGGCTRAARHGLVAAVIKWMVEGRSGRPRATKPSNSKLSTRNPCLIPGA